LRLLFPTLLLIACGAPEPEPRAEPEPEPEPACGTASGQLPSGLVDLAWHAGAPTTDLLAQTWSFNGYTGPHVLRERRVHEAVRFDLPHPARVHGFTVHWSSIPGGADGARELVAGLYRDFGYNGFDFWADAPLWQGSRCVDDLDGGAATYVLPTPIDVPEPGLIYVAHRQQEPGDPVWGMDSSRAGDRDCGAFEACRSAVNLYDTDIGRHYNGWSFPLPVDYAVTLHVAYTRQEGPETKWFEQVDGPSLGNRGAWGDYDGDGWDDLLTAGPRLYRNVEGALVDVTAQSGLSGKPGSGGVWADYDNDGCLDLFLFAESHTQANALMRSTCDGRFEDVTDAAGIVDYQTYNACDGKPEHIRSPAATAAWADLDADGLVDLYVGNFICWQDYSYYVDTVFHNRGDGTFDEITGTRGLGGQRQATRGVNPADADGDGDLDLLVSHYVLQRNLFFDNQGDGTFVERGRGAGLAGKGTQLNVTTTYWGHSIGTAWGDLDNDGRLDAVVGNLAHPRFFHFSDKTNVLMQVEPGRWEDVAAPWEPDSPSGLRFQETHSVPGLADFNNDGDLDLVLTAVYVGRPTDFYWGNGDGTFALAAYDAGITTTNGWGVAISDYDRDGRVDLATYQLWRNVGAGGSSFQVRAVGDGDVVNRAGLGATVRVIAGGVVRTRHVAGGSGQGNQDSAYLHFGLGDATVVDAVEVAWPGGASTVLEGPFPAGERLWIRSDGASQLGWGAPAW
jgi:hypothetical protein